MAKKIASLVGVLGALYVLCFAGLGLNPLLDPDEPIYGQFVKEMVRSGDWITPHYDGRLWFDKPPLFYWLSSLSVKTLGLNEAAIRMPSALLAVLVLVGVYLLARIDFGRRAAVLAAVVMGTSLLQIIVSHAAATDETMLFCMVAALYCYRKWFDCEGRARFAWMAACGLFAGLGMLTKGPVVPLLLLGAFVCHLAWMRKLRAILSAEAALAVVVAMVVGLPWYIAMWAMHGQVFIDQFIMANNVGRFLQPLHKSQGGQWYSHFVSLALLLLFLFPWNVFLPSAVRRYLNCNVGARLLTCWGGLVLLFFSLSKTQNFTYTLPAFPACAIFIGALINEASESKELGRKMRPALITGCILSVLYAIALVITIGGKFPGALPYGVVGAGILCLLFLAPAVGVLTDRLSMRRASMVMGASMVAFTAFAIGWLLPVATDFLSSKSLAMQIGRLPNVTVAKLSLWRPGLFYYLDRAPVTIVGPDQIIGYSADDRPVLIVCDERHEQDLELWRFRQMLDCGNLDAYANQAAAALMQARVP